MPIETQDKSTDSADNDAPVHLRVQVRKVNSDIVSIEWFDEHGGDETYQIDAGQLDQAANDVRLKLDYYIQAYIVAPADAHTEERLRELITAGHDLFLTLFTATRDQVNAEAAKDRYLSLVGNEDLAIEFKVDPALAHPWTLCVPEVPDPATLLDLTRVFWCIRHHVAVSTFGAGLGSRGALSTMEYRAAAAMDRVVYDAASTSIAETRESVLLDTLKERFGGTFAFTFDDLLAGLKRAAEDTQARLRIAYLLGHASGDRFRLSDDDVLSASTFAVRLNSFRSIHRQQTLLFLNGCDTAAEADRFAFTDLLKYPGIAGLIGTEVRVPDRFAFRFALAFFYEVMLNGKSFREAMDDLRRRHLPVSLAYALYASDAICIAKSDSEEILVELAVNFSEGRLTCAP
ncbi:hypothetical protein J7E70_34085 [Variovorax paradoxus]|nr:hypothetical protein [Variovorax paradoxus]MBT2305426.1 hypothetical protein [Variovorax paradoxus]